MAAVFGHMQIQCWVLGWNCISKLELSPDGEIRYKKTSSDLKRGGRRECRKEMPKIGISVHPVLCLSFLSPETRAVIFTFLVTSSGAFNMPSNVSALLWLFLQNEFPYIDLQGTMSGLNEIRESWAWSWLPWPPTTASYLRAWATVLFMALSLCLRQCPESIYWVNKWLHSAFFTFWITTTPESLSSTLSS